MSEESIYRAVLSKIKAYLKWYTYPLAYFMVTSLVCLFAWSNRPLNHRESIKVVFKTISLTPTIIWFSVITIWIFIVILFSIFMFRLKRAFSGFSETDRPGDHRGPLDEPAIVKESKKNKFTGRISYSVGVILIFVGLTLGGWIARPYISLLLSASKIAALEKKAQQQTLLENRIIIPSILVDAPILEGVNMGQLSRGVCHLSSSSFPGEGGNSIIEGHNLAEFGIWKPKSFFSLLDIVEEGTPIYVFYNRKKYTYTVKEKTFRDVNDPRLYNAAPGERLTLITCVSTWSPTIYTNKRTVVIAYPAL